MLEKCDEIDKKTSYGMTYRASISVSDTSIECAKLTPSRRCLLGRKGASGSGVAKEFRSFLSSLLDTRVIWVDNEGVDTTFVIDNGYSRAR